MVQKYDIESIYITTADYNNLTNDIFTNKIKSKVLVDISKIYRFINNTDLDKKLPILIATLATKVELKQNKIK